MAEVENKERKGQRNVKQEQMKYQCAHCLKFLSKTTYERHKKKMTCMSKPTLKYKCGKFENAYCFFCLKKTSSECDVPIRYTEKRLVSHFLEFHSQPEELDFCCESCDMKFPIQMMLNTHNRKMHSNKFKCGICCRNYQYKRQLEKHELTHKKLSDAEKIYKCSFCSFSSALLSRKTCHEKKTHDYTGEFKKHMCIICGKLFIYKHMLVSHERTHSQDKSYRCNLCPKEYKQEKGLRLHRVNFHDMKHVCDLCGKNSFSSARGLLIHQREVHGQDVNLNAPNVNTGFIAACKLFGNVDECKGSLETAETSMYKYLEDPLLETNSDFKPDVKMEADEQLVPYLHAPKVICKEEKISNQPGSPVYEI